ncbi:hypothetical protein F53441_11849 [Fusarium austroafricanum]|uniref:Uncharacterized protein n=1 Tax=Fusarium austroafricanum TaxID=2364996 RepID=A0A8H4NKY3_9HYPO|nr:hypothetical protein F53441_11849 [Fusarium austroafricanum]
MQAHLREVLEREQQYLDAKTQPRFYSKALGDDSFAATSLWLERTRWPITYKNMRRDILQAMTRLPIHDKVGSVETDYILGQGPLEGDPDIIISTGDEEKIMCFLSAVDAMLDRCELTAENTSRVLLYWLASSRLDICQAKPFALKVEQNTRKSISGEESSDDYESSEEEDGIFEDSEREDSLDDWMYDMDNRHVPGESSFCRDSGHRSIDSIAIESAKEFLKLLFELMASWVSPPTVDDFN